MASFVKKDGHKLLVIRPTDVELQKQNAQKALDENYTEAEFNLILTTQPYTIVGFLGRGVGGKHVLLDHDGKKIGEMESWDSFVGTKDDADLDSFRIGETFEAEAPGVVPLKPEEPNHGP
jgi:hypothetical protein